MARNTFKGQSSPRSKPRSSSRFRGIGGIQPFNSDLLLQNLPFIFFLGFLGIIYIANSHYGIRMIKSINRTQEELKEVGWKSNSIKSELMYNTMQSELAKKAYGLGLRELKERPYTVDTEGK